MGHVKAIPNIPAAPGKTIAAIFLLPNCDMGCTFCASDLGFDRMSFEQACNLIQALSNAGYHNVVLGGGEPALWRDGDKNLADVAHFAKGLGLTVQVNTNGIRLPQNFAQLDHVDRFIFPMDGASATKHDSLRVILGAKPGGHFDLVKRRVAECIEAVDTDTIHASGIAQSHGTSQSLRHDVFRALRQSDLVSSWDESGGTITN